MVDLLTLLHQAGDLRWGEVQEFLGSKHGFQPQLDPKAVLEFALKHGVSDLRMAADQYRQQQAKSRASEPARHFRNREPQGEREFRAMIGQRYPHAF